MSRSLITRPRRDDGTLLPAALATLMVALLVVQFATVRGDMVAVDEGDGVKTSFAVGTVPSIPPVVAPSIIEERPIFAPWRLRGGAATAADPLAGAVVAGTWSVGRHTNLVLRELNGASRTVAVGQSVGGWIVAAITPDGARLVRQRKSIIVRFGTALPSDAPGNPGPSNQQAEENQ